MLEDLDQKLDGGEELHVVVEIVAVGTAWRDSVEPAGMRIDATTGKPLWAQLTMLLANRSFSSLRFRKNAMTLWRKQALILARSMGERALARSA